MRQLAAFLVVILPLAPFAYYLVWSTYPEGLILFLTAITVLLGLFSLARHTRVSLAGLYSSVVSAGLAVLGGGYVPYFAHIELGSLKAGSESLFGLSVSLALYGYYMGNVYEGASRLSSALKRKSYQSSDVRELDKMALWSAGVAGFVLMVSYGLYLAMVSVRMPVAANGLVALAVFLAIYGAVVVAIRRFASSREESKEVSDDG